jgi:lysophospholipase L1-like esterase
MQPFWLSNTMYGESVLFLQEDPNGRPSAAVFYRPTKILSVKGSSGEVSYEEGKDYVWNPESSKITLPVGSRIPFKKPQDLRRTPGSQPYRLTHRDGNGEILFGGGHEYHDMQTVITYEHSPEKWAAPVPTFAGDQLPNTMKLLAEKKPLTIGLLGDSISTGCNASGCVNTVPFQPAYFDLFAQRLESAYGSKVTLKNFSVGGMASNWGLQNVGRVMEIKPDLVIVAFGMNDAAGIPPAQYQENIRQTIAAIHAANPKTEVILVATMLANDGWITLHHDFFPQFRDGLQKLATKGVVVADMTSIWMELMKRKKDWDMTGNGVNHPNDFGHRIYAQVLSTLLIRNP